ncbi:hypothetical protein PC122_g20680 [Phytophthora cactorum]|nr:hypothetical protein PC122_g20680 [Phytophthora cactorum]
MVDDSHEEPRGALGLQSFFSDGEEASSGVPQGIVTGEPASAPLTNPARPTLATLEGLGAVRSAVERAMIKTERAEMSGGPPVDPLAPIVMSAQSTAGGSSDFPVFWCYERCGSCCGSNAVWIGRIQWLDGNADYAAGGASNADPAYLGWNADDSAAAIASYGGVTISDTTGIPGYSYASPYSPAFSVAPGYTPGLSEGL